MKSPLLLRCLLYLLLFFPVPVSAEVYYLGSVSVAGDTQDLSGLEGTIGNETPHNLFGAIGGLEHVSGNRYLALPDRGPLDGASQFQCRLHQIELTVIPAESSDIRFTLLQTSMFKTESGRALVGAFDAFDLKNPSEGLRFDPEGVRVNSAGAVFISDEYGPFLCEFNLSGSRQRTITTPTGFSIAHPSADSKLEEKLNSTGRSANGGWEGIAITPDESRLVLATQKSLLQDSNINAEGEKNRSRVLRLVDIELSSGTSRQFAYVAENAKNGISELLAVNTEDYLVLERDGEAGHKAQTKRIYRVSTKDATDISSLTSLPGDALPENVVPVRKTLLLDLLDPRWGLAGPECPEKWEGLAFGPTLSDGRRLLWIATDNDYVAETPTQFHAFAIDVKDMPGFAWEK